MKPRSALLAWAAASVALLAAKAPTLSDPPYWDALGCYLPQARLLAALRFHLGAYRGVDFVRPPGYTALLAVAQSLSGHPLFAAHVLTCLVAAACLPATWALARALGATPRSAALATLFCALNPVYFAQAGIPQSDLAATALTTVAFTLLVGGRTIAFAVCAAIAVLTKESAWFLSVPAALLLYGRALGVDRSETGLRRHAGALLSAAPAAVPGLTLAAWLVIHRLLTGHSMAHVQTSSIGSPSQLGSALLHDFVESGRPLLCAAAGLVALPALGRIRRAGVAHCAPRDLSIAATAALVVALPFCFPASVVRYMLPSLPPLCALAALGLAALSSRRRMAAAALISGASLLLFFGESWHVNYGHHLEGNLAYRDLLKDHVAAARILAAQRPRSVIAGFPMWNALTAPPEDGVLPTPIAAHRPRGDESAEELCRSDYLVSTEGSDLSATKAALDLLGARRLFWQSSDPGAGALTPPWARVDRTVRIDRIDCPVRPVGAGTSGIQPL